MEPEEKRKKRQDGPMAGGESSAEYMISGSEGKGSVPAGAKVAPTGGANPAATEAPTNEARKEVEGKALAGGESSAEYMIEKSAGESRVPDSAKTKPALSTDTKSAAENAERKEKGEPLAGGESSADYMISESGKGSS